MPRKDTEKLFEVVEKTLANLGKHFAPGELKYLASTGKIESTIRDKLAYLLHADRELSSFFVYREWKKIDIAIVPKKDVGGLRAAVALQLKAKSSTYKIIKDASSLRKVALEDLRKCRSKASKSYTLLIAPHFPKNPVRNSEIVPKYKCKSVSEAAIHDAVIKAFKGWHIIGSNTGKRIGLGERSFSVFYWLCKRQ